MNKIVKIYPKMNKIEGNIIDIINRNIYPGEIIIKNSRIVDIIKNNNAYSVYILPGLIDAHVHIESSMITPENFAATAIKHGTVAVLADPHEIANVLGVKGIDFMYENGKNSPIKFFWGIPSCVPATPFDVSGSIIDSGVIDDLFNTGNFSFLAEMMNYPGVINRDKDVHKKLGIARKYKKRIDGHAPGLSGKELELYIKSGISTDHECVSYLEAKEKINKGMKILIREGSAAKNFDALNPLIHEFPDELMFCTDDCHPDDLIKGHINRIVKKALNMGYDVFDVLKIATINPVKHYKIPVGLLQKGDFADFVVVDNLSDFNVISTCVNGLLYDNNLFKQPINPNLSYFNTFIAEKINSGDITCINTGNRINIINLINNEIITKKSIECPFVNNGNIVPNTDNDVLKLVYYNRYVPAKPKVAFVKNFGLKIGAIAQSIAHDNHNIIAIGTNDEDLVFCINKIVELKGGIVFSEDKKTKELPLEIAGIMSGRDISFVAEKYREISDQIKDYGCSHNSPLMILSFLSLIVIPEIKIGEKGLFDVNEFKFIDLFTWK